MATREEQFEAFLKDLKVPDDIKTTLREGAKADPEVMNACLRQADYDRFMNENKKKVELSDKWQSWADENVPKHTKLVEDYKTLETKYNEALSGKEINMTDEQLATKVEEILKTKGLTGASATQEQITQAVNKALGDAVNAAVEKKGAEFRDNFLKNDVPASNIFITQMVDAQLDFHDQFGKKLDTVQFSKFIADGKYNTVADAYKDFTAKEREAKESEARKKEIDEAVAKARQEERDNLAKQQGLPGSTTLPPDAVQGPVAAFIAHGKDGGAAAGNGGNGGGSGAAAPFSPTASRAAAVTAAAELRSAGKV